MGVFPSDQPYALKIVWKKPLGAGYSSISIRGDLAVTMYSDETFDYVIGLNTEDGSQRWKYKIGAAYLGHYGSQSGPLSTPIVTEDKVIALGPRGKLFALDANTGKELWKIDAAHRATVPFWGFTSSPILHDNHLIVQTGGTHAVSAYDPASGDLIWSAFSDSVNYQSPGLYSPLKTANTSSSSATNISRDYLPKPVKSCGSLHIAGKPARGIPAGIPSKLVQGDIL